MERDRCYPHLVSSYTHYTESESVKHLACKVEFSKENFDLLRPRYARTANANIRNIRESANRASRTKTRPTKRIRPASISKYAANNFGDMYTFSARRMIRGNPRVFLKTEPRLPLSARFSREKKKIAKRPPAVKRRSCIHPHTLVRGTAQHRRGDDEGSPGKLQWRGRRRGPAARKIHYTNSGEPGTAELFSWPLPAPAPSLCLLSLE